MKQSRQQSRQQSKPERRRSVLVSLDTELLDVYTAAATASALDRNSVIVAALRITAENGAALGVAVEMARGSNGNIERSRKMAELQRQRQQQQQRKGRH